jgi:hypothetical protein
MTGTTAGSGITAYTTPGNNFGRGQVIIYGEAATSLYVGGMV